VRVSPLSTSYPVGPHGCLTTTPLARDGLQGSGIRLKYRRISAKTGNDLYLPGRVGRDWLKIGGYAASAIGGNESFAGWNFRPWSAPNVPL
jgi:hypothetical protein